MAMLLEARCILRLTKLEKRSPAMAKVRSGFLSAIRDPSAPRRWTFPTRTLRRRGWFSKARIWVLHRQRERRHRAGGQTQRRGFSWRRQLFRWPQPAGSAAAATTSHAFTDLVAETVRSDLPIS